MLDIVPVIFLDGAQDRLVERFSPVRNRLMNEASGASGDLPLLLRGLPI